MTPIPRGLLIAGGLGLAAGAGFLLFKNMKKEDAPVDPAADPAAAGAGGMTPTAGTPGAAGPTTPGMTPTGTTMPGAPGAGTGSGSGALAGGQQVGPYTVIPDPQSGQMMVFETATEQPVGILDAQGNLVPLEGSGGALGPGAGTGNIPAGQGTIVPEGPGLTPTGTTSSVPQAATGQAQFAAIAQDLFANAGNGGVGSASSDAMAGQSSLAPTTGLDAGATSSSTPVGVGAPTGLAAGTGVGAGTGTAGVGTASAGVSTSTAGIGTGTAGVGTATAGVGTASASIKREQVGNFTLIDDGSGTKIVLDTASQKPVAMMDASGTVTPITVDAQGNVSVSGPPLSSAQVAAAVGGGGGVGSSVAGFLGM